MGECTAHCCEAFTLMKAGTDLRDAWPDGLASMSREEIQRYALREEGDPGSRYEDAAYVADMVIPIGSEPTQICPSDGRDVGGPVWWYTCRHFDTEARRCKEYEARPRMCSGYGESYACEHHGCPLREARCAPTGSVRRPVFAPPPRHPREVEATLDDEGL